MEFEDVGKDFEFGEPTVVGEKPVIIKAEVFNKKTGEYGPGNWDKYDLFKNNWEHNVFFDIGNKEEEKKIRMLELLSSKKPNIVKAIFKYYKLKLVPEDSSKLTKFVNALFEVIVNKKRNVGAHIDQNSFRCIP